MRVRIHRGANEIGGSCIELEACGQHLVLDLGLPLWARTDDEVPLPRVPGLEHPDDSLVGIVISHPHVDHYGLSTRIRPSVPLFMGEAAHRILAEASFFTGGAVPPAPHGYLRHRVPFAAGPFTITPYLNDHSAFDAYSLLIEAQGQRLFYTGDIRAHGRKRGAFEQLLRDPPTNIDTLLMEGTNVRHSADLTRRGPTEREVEEMCVRTCRATRGMVLALYSPQNIDRLVTLYRAALRSGRELVIDLYTATIVAATRTRSIPAPDWQRVRLYLPRAQKRRLVKTRAFARLDNLHAHRIFADELTARRAELIMTFRSSMSAELAAARCLDDATAIWSMWPGYLREHSGVLLQNFLDEHDIPLVTHHASGHAFVPDLQRLVAALAPRRVVPIHTSNADDFAGLFPHVERHDDGAWW